MFDQDQDKTPDLAESGVKALLNFDPISTPEKCDKMTD
jgi:hypothetical protein